MQRLIVRQRRRRI